PGRSVPPPLVRKRGATPSGRPPPFPPKSVRPPESDAPSHPSSAPLESQSRPLPGIVPLGRDAMRPSPEAPDPAPIPPAQTDLAELLLPPPVESAATKDPVRAIASAEQAVQPDASGGGLELARGDALESRGQGRASLISLPFMRRSALSALRTAL